MQCNTAVTKEVDALAMQLIQVAAGVETNARPGESPPRVSPFKSVGLHKETVFVTYDRKTDQRLELPLVNAAGGREVNLSPLVDTTPAVRYAPAEYFDRTRDVL